MQLPKNKDRDYTSVGIPNELAEELCKKRGIPGRRGYMSLSEYIKYLIRKDLDELEEEQKQS